MEESEFLMLEVVGTFRVNADTDLLTLFSDCLQMISPFTLALRA